MTDFRISTTWRGHRKRRRLQKELGPEGVVALEDLWSHAAEMHQDGILSGMTAEDMAAEVNYAADAQRMLATFVDLRLMDPPTDRCKHYRLHDWADHQRWVVHAPERIKAARSAAKIRWKNRMRSACGAHAEGNAESCGAHAEGNAPSPSPNPSPDPDPNTTPHAARARTSSGLSLLLEEKIPEGVAQDFLTLRRAKRAPLTKVALARIIGEATKAGITLEAALQECCARGWQGFVAEWYAKDHPGNKAAVAAAGKKFHDWDFFEHQPARLWVDLSDGKRPFSTDSQRDQLNRCREAHPEWF